MEFLGMEWYWWLFIVVAIIAVIPIKVKFIKWWTKREQEKNKKRGTSGVMRNDRCEKSDLCIWER